MGCIESRLGVLDRAEDGDGEEKTRRFLRRQSRKNLFQVYNVDDLGRQVSPGKLEVSVTDLIFHVQGKPALSWPLRCLRRYGYDEDLFSFESGRRCPTGSGIFAFRCARARSLFNLLQERIQTNQSPHGANVCVPISPSNGPVVQPSDSTSPINQTFDYVNISSETRPSLVSSSNPTQPHVYVNVAENQNLITMLQTFPNFAHSVSSVGTNGVHFRHGILSHTSSATSQEYQNIPSGEKIGRFSSQGYCNILSNLDLNQLQRDGSSCNNNEKDPSSGYDGTECAQVNYAELDLKCEEDEALASISDAQSAASQQLLSEEPNQAILSSSGNFKNVPRIHGSKNRSDLGYATIDFDRTAALNLVTRCKLQIDSRDKNGNSTNNRIGSHRSITAPFRRMRTD